MANSTARQAVAGPLTLTNGARRAALAPDVIARNLRFVPDGKGGLRPRFNARAAVATRCRTSSSTGRKAPKDASFKVVKGKVVVVPHRDGMGVDAAALKKDVERAIAGGREPYRAGEAHQGAAGAHHRQGAQARHPREGVSYTTHYPCCPPRVTNIHRIADILDGHLVMPGETFSLNGVVGKRDKARGFVEAPMILNGRYVDDVGGGISQFVTTMFNAVFFGGFEDVQHTPHMYYISRYPAGRESTVSYPQPDFRWRNDSPYGVLITTSYTNTSVTVNFWSTKRYDIESRSSGRYDDPAVPDDHRVRARLHPDAGRGGLLHRRVADLQEERQGDPPAEVPHRLRPGAQAHLQEGGVSRAGAREGPRPRAGRGPVPFPLEGCFTERAGEVPGAPDPAAGRVRGRQWRAKFCVQKSLPPEPCATPTPMWVRLQLRMLARWPELFIQAFTTALAFGWPAAMFSATDAERGEPGRLDAFEQPRLTGELVLHGVRGRHPLRSG